MAKGIKPKPPKQKKCNCCPEKFIPRNISHICCSPACAYQYAIQQSERKKKEREKADRIAWNNRKADVKPLSHWLKLAQQAFNEFIRTRDADEPCISCGRMHDGQWHAGHYRTVKASPETRFDEDGCHKQCMPCNHHLSGNIPGYKPNLIAKIGHEAFDSLMGPHELKKWTREELQELAAHYRKKTKELNKQREAA